MPVPPHHLERLFEAFFSTEIGKCGAITVRSTLGQGTCFEIRLPRVLPATV